MTLLVILPSILQRKDKKRVTDRDTNHGLSTEYFRITVLLTHPLLKHTTKRVRETSDKIYLYVRSLMVLNLSCIRQVSDSQTLQV